MVNDSSRIINDIQVSLETMVPDIDVQKLLIRLEEIAANYEIKRKSAVELENDLEEKVELFLSAKKLDGLSSITLSGYKLELSLFQKYANKATVKITTTDIRGYLSSQETENMGTISKKLCVLKSFFGWLVKEELLLRDPTSKVKHPKLPQRLPRSLSIEQLEIVRESCETLRERALIEFMYSSGCRLSEISNLKRSQVNLQNMSARVIGKGDKERIVYISHRALYHLEKYLDERTDNCDYLFVTMRNPIRKLENRSIQREIDKIEKRANIPVSLTPHTMRHTFATLAVENGADLTDIQQLLGHEDPGTSLVYINVSEERRKQAHRRHHVQ